MRRHIVTVGLVLAVAGTVTGCSSSGDPGPLFNNEGAAEISCLAHQTGAPGERYTVRERRNTVEVLSLMKYYTANGTKPFCDNAPAGESDKAWATAYVDLGGTAEKVASVLR